MDLRLFYRILGAACLAYFLLFSVCSRFGLSLSWLWIVLGGILLAAGALTGRVPRGVAIAFRAVMLTGLAALLALQGLVVSGMTARTPPGLDYLIVLGARVDADGPSRSLRWRINAAAEYLRENPDTLVIDVSDDGSGKYLVIKNMSDKKITETGGRYVIYADVSGQGEYEGKTYTRLIGRYAESLD